MHCRRPEALRRSKLTPNLGEPAGRDTSTLIQIITRCRCAGSLEQLCLSFSLTPRRRHADIRVDVNDKIERAATSLLLVCSRLRCLSPVPTLGVPARMRALGRGGVCGKLWSLC